MKITVDTNRLFVDGIPTGLSFQLGEPVIFAIDFATLAYDWRLNGAVIEDADRAAALAAQVTALAAARISEIISAVEIAILDATFPPRIREQDNAQFTLNMAQGKTLLLNAEQQAIAARFQWVKDLQAHGASLRDAPGDFGELDLAEGTGENHATGWPAFPSET